MKHTFGKQDLTLSGLECSTAMRIENMEFFHKFNITDMYVH